MDRKGDTLLKRSKAGGFTTIKNSVLENPSLSLKAKGLFAYLQSKATLSGWRFHKKILLTIHKDGRESLDAAIKELKNAGLLVIARRKGNDSKYGGWEWTIHDEAPNEKLK